MLVSVGSLGVLIARGLTEPRSTPSAGDPVGPLYIRAWTLVGQGSHMAWLYVAAGVSYFRPPTVYFCLSVFAVVMKTMMGVLLLTDTWAARS
jgi:hypothetical protein